MKIFFDTEFTGLKKSSSLISLGMVDENGRTFYAEFLGYNSDDYDEWVKDNVIANLKYKTCIDNWHNGDPLYTKDFICVGYRYYIRPLLERWLSIYDNVELVSDVCHYDMVLFIDIFGTAFDLPKNVCPSCHDINQDIAYYLGVSEKEAFDYSREELISTLNRFKGTEDTQMKVEKHNSLYDAKVIKELYKHLKMV